MSLSGEQQFEFDLQGYVVLRGVLSAAECSRLSALADQAWPAQPGDGPDRRTERISRWGSPFLDLIDHDAVLPALIDLVGPKLRLDHDYCLFMRRGGRSSTLHGGPFLFETDHWYRYHDGVMRNGLTVATFTLVDAPRGAGGFVCIPGSHKTNYLRELPEDVRSLSRRPDYVVQPELGAGDVVIFTEALIHGTAPWTADHERRALLYKYSPPHSAWALDRYDHADYPNATARQLRLMAPPSVERHARVIAPAS